MTEYIDREKVEAQLRAYADNVPERFSEVIKGLIDAVVLDLTDAIKDMPTADVRENVSGKWVSASSLDWYLVYKCSNCGEYGNPKHNFCPNYGADNRGDTDG